MTAVGMSDEQLQEMLALAGGSDSVELKLTVPEEHHRSTAMALGMDPLDAQVRMVSFFDTPELTLNQAGVVVRARRVQGRVDDSVIKLRPVVPEEIPDVMRRSPSRVVELDAMPGGYVCSASIKARIGEDDVRRCVVGERPDGSRILELSTKCPPSEMFQVAAVSRGYLAGRGVDLSGQQQTKTATALAHFVSHLDA
jgi:hypothetical protein